ncbi:MAG: tetratricopeptide repeat protein [Methylophilaceae bacterium]|nr:tetratricopeptide repeat protein [Methylophilaceae bacterium]
MKTIFWQPLLALLVLLGVVGLSPTALAGDCDLFVGSWEQFISDSGVNRYELFTISPGKDGMYDAIYSASFGKERALDEASKNTFKPEINCRGVGNNHYEIKFAFEQEKNKWVVVNTIEISKDRRSWQGQWRTEGSNPSSNIPTASIKRSWQGQWKNARGLAGGPSNFTRLSSKDQPKTPEDKLVVTPPPKPPEDKPVVTPSPKTPEDKPVVTPSPKPEDICNVQTDSEKLACLLTTTKDGNAEAQFQLAQAHLQGDLALQKNIAEAVRLYQLAAEQGHQSAMLEIGKLYQRAGPFQNFNEALKWYQSLANLGNSQAFLLLGKLYMNGGAGLAKNWGEALKWLDKCRNTCSADDKKQAREAIRKINEIHSGQDEKIKLPTMDPEVDLK